MQIQYLEEKGALLVGLSHKVRNFNELDIKILGDHGKGEEGGENELKFDVNEVVERRLNKSIASTWKLSLVDLANPDGIKPNKLSLSIKQRKEVNKDENG